MEIFRLLDNSKVVYSYRITDFKTWNTGVYIKLEIILEKNDLLYVREYNDEKERRYSFHWQDKQDSLIVRWDNAPHHKHLGTFPHHKHTAYGIEESNEISLEDILRYIEKFSTDC